MTVTYPEEFRCAQITPYRVNVGMGVLRTPMESGLQRQRRLYKTMPHAFQLEFVMTVPELGQWQPWVNQYAYDYFVMQRLETWIAGRRGEISSPHSVRFTSDLEFDNPVYGWVRVRVAAELDPIQPPEAMPGPVTPGDGWIVAGTPGAPSLAWIVAGSPAAPSADLVSAGSPGFPASLVIGAG
jgi:hypothetical protein